MTTQHPTIASTTQAASIALTNATQAELHETDSVGLRDPDHWRCGTAESRTRSESTFGPPPDWGVLAASPAVELRQLSGPREVEAYLMPYVLALRPCYVGASHAIVVRLTTQEGGTVALDRIVPSGVDDAFERCITRVLDGAHISASIPAGEPVVVGVRKLSAR